MGETRGQGGETPQYWANSGLLFRRPGIRRWAKPEQREYIALPRDTRHQLGAIARVFAGRHIIRTQSKPSCNCGFAGVKQGGYFADGVTPIVQRKAFSRMNIP